MNDVTTKAPRLSEAQKRSVACPTCLRSAGKACRKTSASLSRSALGPHAATLVAGGGWGGPPDLDRAHDARRQEALRAVPATATPAPAAATPATRRQRAPKPHTATIYDYVNGQKIIGTTVTLAPRVETGLGLCPGEAHKNAFIDNCMLCAPRWGQVMTYAPPTPDQCTAGFAVPVSETGGRRGGTDSAFEAAEKAGLIKIVSVETRSSSFSVYVATGCTKHSDCRDTPALGRACAGGDS